MNSNKLDIQNYYGLLKCNNQIFFLDKEINIIGRSPSCHIILTHVSISKQHCWIEFNNRGEAFLKDNNSLNASYVNDVKVLNGQSVAIKTNDKIKIGKDPTNYIFENNRELQGNRGLDDTRQTSSIIKDDRVSLVNQEFIPRTIRNHFAKSGGDLQVSPNRFNHNMEMEMKSNEDNKSKGSRLNTNSNVITGGSDVPSPKLSPKFNVVDNRGDFDDNEFNLTFKQKKHSSDYNDEKLKALNEEYMIKSENLTNANMNLEKKNVELEEKILKSTNEFKKLTNNFEQVNDEYSKLNAKHNALMIYASDLQKKVDLLEIEINEKKEELSRFKTLDWGKLIIERDNLIKILQSDLHLYKGELNTIKANIMNDQKGGYANDMTKRIDSLMDNFLVENKKYKKILEEYKSRENECNKKWNELLKENNLNIERNNLLHQQLNDQNDNFNNMIADFDRRLVESLSKIPLFFDNYDTKKSEAAKYLIEQMNITMEEKRKLVEENNTLINQVNETTFEIEKLKQDYKTLSSCFEVNSHYNNSFNSTHGGNSINVKQLKQKIEELEDLITQQKNTNSPHRTVELEENIMSINNKLQEKEKINEQLVQKLKEYLKKAKGLFDEKQAVYSLTMALREKDIIILNLKNNLKDCKDMDKVRSYELDNLSRMIDRQNVENQNSQKDFEDYSSREKGFSSQMFIEKVETYEDLPKFSMEVK